ncbi:unnamed protein product [Phyllotreta striolata]|uniref:ATPase AAA-type core domain-containing protein n=1 Tax=Phyllotreta striolata TaxID=444603 RepID=A0A9N9XQD0_PHYSR|nr:unnamed protein product [Phyllotreta striolata]
MAKLNNQMWIFNKQELEKLHLKDSVWRAEEPLINTRKLGSYNLGDWYVQYSLLYQKLDTCLDQMVQPQKRLTVKKLVDAIAIRLMEFNDELRNLDYSEIHYFDGNLIELKLIPQEIEILHPTLFTNRPVTVEEMLKKFKQGEKVYFTPEELEEIERLKREAELEAERLKRRPPRPGASRIQISPEEERKRNAFNLAVKKIQTAERARQERVFFGIKHSIVMEKQKMRALAIAKALGQVQNVETQTEEERIKIHTAAAIIIQTYWRGYKARKQRKYDEEQRKILIGMYVPPWRSKAEFDLLEQNLNKRRELREQRLKEYVEGIEKEKVRILKFVRPRIMEEIGDEIRQWFADWYYNCHKFDEFPAEVLGGTVVVMRGETYTPQEYLQKIADEKAMGPKALKELRQQEKNDAKMAKFAESEKRKAEEKLKKKLLKKKQAEIKAMLPHHYKYYFEPPKYLPLLQQGALEHKIYWDEIDELKNPLEKHYTNLITDDIIYETQLECRRIVDELMRLELNMLLNAYTEDTGKKTNPPANKKIKEKKKRGKDITSDRSIEDLFQELVDNGVIRTYPKVSLDDFRGDFAYHNWELRDGDLDNEPSLLDLRQAVVMNIILPMGVTEMRRPKSLLISGPSKSGKHVLANAIFNATRCVLFDLSLETTAFIYEDDEIDMLVHLVKKMSKLLQPSIIFFDNAEKTFYKRVPAEEKLLRPKRLGKYIPAFIKNITDQDRIMILGITSNPTAASNQLNKLYERHILIPRTDYSTLYMLWSELLLNDPWVDRNINVTLITRVTTGFTYPVIRDLLNGIFHIRRVLQIKNKPLTAEEIFSYIQMNNVQGVTDEAWAVFDKWWRKFPFSKKKAAYLRAAKEQRERDAL